MKAALETVAGLRIVAHTAEDFGRKVTMDHKHTGQLY